MNLKQVNWKLILLSSIFMIIAITIFLVITDDFSWVSIIISALIFPTFGLIGSFSKIDNKQIKGCLYGKTEKMKKDYFESLYNLKDEEPIFLLEQSRDLLDDEFDEFICWIFDNKYPVFFEYKALSLIKTFEVIKPTNDMEKVGEMLILSTFGEYCPEKSLRGYKLSFLLKNKENYKPKLILQEGNLAIVS